MVPTARVEPSGLAPCRASRVSPRLEAMVSRVSPACMLGGGNRTGTHLCGAWWWAWQEPPAGNAGCVASYSFHWRNPLPWALRWQRRLAACQKRHPQPSSRLHQGKMVAEPHLDLVVLAVVVGSGGVAIVCVKGRRQSAEERQGQRPEQDSRKGGT